MSVIKRYLHFVKPYRWKIVGTLLIGVVKFAIPLLIPLLMKYVIDGILGASHLNPEQKTRQLLTTMGIMFGLFLVLRPPIEYYRQYFAQWTASKILFDIRERLFSHIQKLSFKFYSNTRSGEIISRVINDVEQTKEFVITGLMNLWLDLTTVFIAIVIMISLDVPLTLVSLIVFPLYMFSVRYFFGHLRKLTRERSQALAGVQSYLHERVGGMSVIKSFAIEDHESKNFNETNTNFLNKALTHTSWNAKAHAVVNTITDLAPLIVLSFAGYQVINAGLSIGTLVAFMGYVERLYNPLRRLVNSSTTLTQAIASMDRVFELVDEKYDIDDAKDAIELRDVKGNIKIEQVTFAYDEKEAPVLKEIDLNIQAGETIALVGMSGGGKSSLVSLIPRFYDVSSGQILLDDVDIRKLKVRSLRKQIGMVLQDSILFSESVKANILLGNPGATDEEVYAAAKAANAHEFIMQLPNGYDTTVGERGVKLSGGQKQRISIARVFLKNPSILIFDEATSALDLESEALIQEAMAKLSANRTTIIIAHRLSTITHADRIVLMDHGEIAEVGSHAELMEMKGHYYDLFQVQQLE